MTPVTSPPNVPCTRRQIIAGLLLAVAIGGGWLWENSDGGGARLYRTPAFFPPPIAGMSPATGAARRTLGLRIDLNRASARDLQVLPGIGPGLAGRIVAFRREHGPFVSPEELLQVKGIGKKRLVRLRPLIEVTPPLRSAGRRERHLQDPDLPTHLSQRENQSSM